MMQGMARRCLIAACMAGLSFALPAAPMVAPAALTPVDQCDFAALEGLEFRFSPADADLREFEYVLFKKAPSLAREPLAYAMVSGRRGKLTGRTVIRDGITWFEGVLDDCSPVYAEDASRNSSFDPLDHLAFFGKVVFEQLHRDARELLGQELIVRGEGLEPRQRLYTADRYRSYPLHDAQRLTVIGIDARRYAHAKGVGPFFLRVVNELGQVGLIKLNPRYLRRPHGELALRSLQAPVLPEEQPTRAEEPATLQVAASNSGFGRQRQRSYVLTVSHFLDEAQGLAAEQILERDGFNARLQAYGDAAGGVIYKLQIAGLASQELAAEMARMLAGRFEWIGSAGHLTP